MEEDIKEIIDNCPYCDDDNCYVDLGCKGCYYYKELKKESDLDVKK